MERFSFLKNIYLAAQAYQILDLPCGMWGLNLVAALEHLVNAMWDVPPDQGSNHKSPALGAWSVRPLDHQGHPWKGF